MSSAEDFEGKAKKVRGVYEEHPYPAEDASVLTDWRWRLAPMEWMEALWKPGGKEAAPKRILVAGCGTGREAFQLRRRFPKAEIVAVDFSPRSISIARELQKLKPTMRSIQFAVADLAKADFCTTAGGDFDFISCHGVLSYIPRPERALGNLGRCLAQEGALYLGVNGKTHHSVGGRHLLKAFGIDPLSFQESRRLRQLLQMSDSLLGREGEARLAKRPAGYLAGDLFGPVIHNLPLGKWIAMAATAKLHLQGDYGAYHLLRRVLENDLAPLLMPLSRAEQCELVDALAPASFHSLLFMRRPAIEPPWKDTEALLEWRTVRTNLHQVRLPKRTGSWGALRKVTFRSAATNTRMDCELPEWELEILRRSDGTSSLRSVVQNIPFSIPRETLRRQLFILTQLLAIQLRPPMTAHNVGLQQKPSAGRR